MTRTARLKFIAKLKQARAIAQELGANFGAIAKAADLAGIKWGVNATFAFGDEKYEDIPCKWLMEKGATSKNIRAVFDNSIAAQEKLL